MRMWKGEKPEEETDLDDDSSSNSDGCNYLHRDICTRCDQSRDGTSKCSDEGLDLEHEPGLEDVVYPNDQSNDGQEVEWFVLVSLRPL